MVHNRNGKGTCLHCKLPVFDDVEKIGKLNALVCISIWMDQRYEIFFIKKSPKGFICYHSDKSDI